jgi:hypothetical protein
LLRRDWQIEVVHATQEDPRLPAGPIDAVLIVNTYHEIAEPRPTLARVFQSMKAQGRLVIANRRSRNEGATLEEDRRNHRLAPTLAEDDVRSVGFHVSSRDEHFIDPADEDPWWLLVGEKQDSR